VYARVTLANKHMDPELECVSSSTGKSEGLGPLTGGMLFTISLGMARRLMLPKPMEQGNLVVLEELGAQGVAFEIAGRAIVETDEKGLGAGDQIKLARKLARDL